MNKVLAMILAGGTGTRLSLLSHERAKPAVPFGGMYRIIDFTLSNCVNSGIFRVAVLTQYNPRSLREHIGMGKAWDLDRLSGGIVLLQPYLGAEGGEWYKGTADAIRQNLSFVEEQRVEQVLILAGDHVYTMRYDLMISYHRLKGADITVGVVPVSPSEVSRFGIVTLDSRDRIIDFQEKPAQATSNLASMGIYVFNKKFLLDCLEATKQQGGDDFGRDIVPALLGQSNVYAYRFNGYWRDIGTIEAYWQANMDLIVDLPEFNLYDPDTMVLTSGKWKPPAKMGPFATISRSLVCPGCIINGEVRSSVLSAGVYVEEGARVIDSVVLNDTFVGRGALLERCVVDKEVWVGPECHIGFGQDYTPNIDEPDHLNSGITLVGKGAVIPPGMNIGRNCKIGCWVEKGDYPSPLIPSGGTVERKAPRRFRV